jgi:hypothetical protein
MRPLSLEDTLADLHSLAVVTAVCPACRHLAQIDVWRVAVRLGWDLPARELAARLKCSQCGARVPTISVRRWRKDRDR